MTTAAGLLTRLYPPAVRERWGDEISREISASGIRSWPDTVAGAARMWLHPADWPETTAGEVRRVLSVATFVLVAATGLVLRTVTPSATLAANIHHPAASLWLAPLLVGIGLAAPRPAFRRTTLSRLSAAAVRTLAAPAAALLMMCLLAWSGMARNVPGSANAALVLYYWLTLGFAVLRLCTFVALVTRAAALPSMRRLSVALVSTGTGLALVASQSLLTAIRGASYGELSQTLALTLLAAAAVSISRDIRRAEA